MNRHRLRSRPTRDWTVSDFQPRPALRPDLRSALEEATQRCDADLVLRGEGQRRAVVFIARGKLAWAATGGDFSALAAVFLRRTGLKPGALKRVFAEARESGAHFADMLVEQEVLDEATVRSVLLEHIARRLLVVNESYVGVVPEVLPARRRTTPDSLSMFSLLQVLAQYELLRGQGAPSEAETESEAADVWQGLDPDAMREALDQVMGWDGAMGAAVLDCEAGLVRLAVSAAGGFDVRTTAAPVIDVVRAELNVVRGLDPDAVVEDVLFTLEDRYHLVRLVPGASNLAILVVLDRQHGNLGLARHGLRSIETELRD